MRRARDAVGVQAPASEAQRHPEAIQVSQGTRGRKDPLRAVWAALTEREFQSNVVYGLRKRGWRVFIVPDMRRTEAGLPDLICIHANWDLMLALELKSETGRVRPEQRDVMAIMHQIPGVYAQIVRPSEWPGVLEWLDSMTR